MVAVRKFLFDTEFDAEPEAEPDAPPPEPTFSEAELVAARAEGAKDGKAQALAEAAKSDDRRAAEALEAIGRAMAGLAGAQARAFEETRQGAIAIAAAIATKIAPEIARRGADESIAAMLGERLPDLLDEPRLVIRLEPARIDAIKDRIDAIAHQCGYAGKVIFLADDALDAPDCRIEWADGGVERAVARVAGEIDQIVAQYLASDGPAPPSHPDAPITPEP
jgi:flagellar assembly protein FliH